MSLYGHAMATFDAPANTATQTQRRALDAFLKGIERKALVTAEYAARHREDALDIVQDAMTGFVKNYRDKPEADWGKLFYTVLSSKINDWRRRASVRRGTGPAMSMLEDESTDMLEQFSDQAHLTPEQLVDGWRSRAAIQDALYALPARQREAFLLRLWEGYDVQQTAYVMGCSEGSVKTHLSRALERLRSYLGAWQ
jgi:RNA polymerase sigma-70 factor, ECF subfamily